MMSLDLFDTHFLIEYMKVKMQELCNLIKYNLRFYCLPNTTLADIFAFL